MEPDELAARLFSDGAGGARVPFLVVRGPRGPRWLIPERPTPALLAALDSWRPYDRVPAAKWSLLRRLYRLGLAGRLPGIERLALAVAEPAPATYLGTPDRRQKAVLFVPDDNGRALQAVRKVALGPEAEAAVAQEAKVLDWLAGHRPGIAPRLLAYDRAAAALSMEWCPGRLVPRTLDPRLLDCLASLALDRTVPTAGADRGLAAWPEVRTLVRATPLPTELPGFVEHGDMAPWNIRRHNGTLYLTDWEDARIEGLPLQDLLAYALAVGHRLERRPVAVALARYREPVRALAQRIGLDARLLPGLVARFLAARLSLAAARGDTALASALRSAAAEPGMLARWA